jgi:hypothetical protein
MEDTLIETPDKMATLSQVLEKLRLKKMDNEFRWQNGQFTAGKGKAYNLIGYSIDAYGVYSNHDDEEGYDNFIRKINVEDRDEQLFFEL